MEKIDTGNMYRSIWDFPENIVDAIDLGESNMDIIIQIEFW